MSKVGKGITEHKFFLTFERMLSQDMRIRLELLLPVESAKRFWCHAW